jgi:hypothetical protein
MRRMMSVGAVVGLAALAAGCNGTPGGGTGTGGNGGPLSGTLTWKENGSHVASVPLATRTKGAARDELRVSGDEPSGTTIDFSVSLAPPLVPGSYPCGVLVSAGRVVSMSYHVGSASSTISPTVPTVCSIVITSLNDATSRATGTFSATLPFDDDTMKTLTDGKFDLYAGNRSP